MRNWRRIWFAALAVAGLSCLVGLLLRSRPEAPEPVYQGRTLGSWLESYSQAVNARNQTANSDAAQAVRAIGTNGIPTLLRMLRAKDSPWKLKLLNWAQRQQLVHLRQPVAEQRNLRASMGFTLLGGQADWTVPELINIYEERISERSQACALASLGSFPAQHERCVPVLTKALHNPSAMVRRSAVLALGMLGVRARPAVPALIESLRDQDLVVRDFATNVLKVINEVDGFQPISR